ncbi:MAG: hypothetical protein SFU91_05230 [Chloroherpetonaceae bacterium]|nr:hypothetical protein [Chloroherpetonaceae bacterium]
MSETQSISNELQQELIDSCDDPDKFRVVLSKLTARDLKPIYDTLYQFVLSESQNAQTVVTRFDLQVGTLAVSAYQQKAKCKEPLGYCTLSMCVRINPTCGTQRLIMLLSDLRPFLYRLLLERPELRSLPKSPEIEVMTYEPISEVQPEREEVKLIETKPPEQVVQKAEIASEMIDKVFRSKNNLWQMVDKEGFEHALVVTEWGDIIESASTKPINLKPIAQALSNEIQSLNLQGKTLSLNRLRVITKEYRNAVVGMYSLGENLYLLGISSAVLPGKLHSIISKSGQRMRSDLA